jgi:hypothetical protein
MPRPRTVVGAALVAATLALIIPHSAAAQTSIDTPTGAPVKEQAAAPLDLTSHAMPGPSLFSFLGGIRSGAAVWLWNWPGVGVIDRAWPVMDVPRFMPAWRESAR